jgi:hypothetical protein
MSPIAVNGGNSTFQQVESQVGPLGHGSSRYPGFNIGNKSPLFRVVVDVLSSTTCRSKGTAAGVAELERVWPITLALHNSAISDSPFPTCGPVRNGCLLPAAEPVFGSGFLNQKASIRDQRIPSAPVQHLEGGPPVDYGVQFVLMLVAG